MATIGIEVVALYRWPLVKELLCYGHGDFYVAWIISANKKHVTSHKTNACCTNLKRSSKCLLAKARSSS